MNGMALSCRYFHDITEPRLKLDYPDVYSRCAAGLVGNGSECFSYDDEISRDHDWGIDFFLWLDEADRTAVPAVQAWKDRLFDEAPPEFKRSRSDYGATVGVMTAGDFYKSLIGYPEGPDDIPGWRRVPEENLAMATNGTVFVDNTGKFTETREKLLRYYPEDLRKKKLAARCMALAQTGQYNLRRCWQRRDWVTYKATLARFSDNAIAAVFLLNRIFRPYYKWAFRRMSELAAPGKEVGAYLLSIAESCGVGDTIYNDNQRDVDRICALLADELRRQKLAVSDDWFLATQGEELQRAIGDAFLRALPAQYE